MADSMYHNFFYQCMIGGIDLTTTTGDVLKMRLHTSTHTPNVDDALVSDLDNEHAASGNYSAGGATVTAGAISPSDDDANDYAKLDITEDITWASSTITARYGILVSTDAVVANTLICWFDFGSDKSSSGGNFTIQFNATGLFTVA